MSPLSVQADVDDLAGAEIPSIVAEAKAKINGHNRRIRRALKSTVVESIASALTLGIALSSNSENLNLYIYGILLSYLPLGYDIGYDVAERFRLKSGIRAYIDTKASSVFDRIGLSFRGNRPSELNNTEREPILTWKSIIAPVDIRPQNNYGIFGSAWNYGYYTADAVVLSPVKYGYNRLSQYFGWRAKPEKPDLAFLPDPCSADARTVIRTKLSGQSLHARSTNPHAVVQLPFQVGRLKTSLRYTLLSTIPDYAKIPFNFLGVVSSAISVYAASLDMGESCMRFAKTGDTEDATLTGVWFGVAFFSLGLGKHCLDDAKNISDRLHRKWAVAAVKRTVIQEREAMKDLQRELKDCIYGLSMASIHQSEEHKRRVMRRISDLLAGTSRGSLDPYILESLRHFSINPYASHQYPASTPA